VYYGAPIELSKALISEQVHILLSTPYRLHHAVKHLDVVNFENVHVLVLDEMQALAA